MSNRNAFALLQEERKILRHKEKKERALERRARKAAGLCPTEPVPGVSDRDFNLPLTSPAEGSSQLKWADVVDDDDEESLDEEEKEIEVPSHEQDLEEFISEDDEEEEEEEEEDFVLTDNTKNNCISNDRLSSTNNLSQPETQDASTVVVPCGKQLSKKERQKLEAQELEDLDVLLNTLGILPSPVSESNDESTIPEACGTITVLETSVTDPAEISLPVNSKPKNKKKKKIGIESTTSSAPAAEMENPQLQSVQKVDALAAARKAVAAGNKKKAKNNVANNSITEAALSEAKKKAEMKKTKQKREKHMFDR